MKKTFNINLSGRVFCMDEDACLKLQAYIDRLEKYYFQEEDGKEILFDIENRIAELFTGYLQERNKETITISDIERVIQIMGTPDDIINEDCSNEVHQIKKEKIFYRNPDTAVFGGIASGIAVYLGISVILVRILFVLFTFLYGIASLLYIILWIIIPKARSAKQKLEMKGEKVNVSNIEKNIRNSFNRVKSNNKIQQLFHRMGKFLSNIFKILCTILKKTFHFIFATCSVFILLGSLLLLPFLFFPPSYTPWSIGYEWLGHIMQDDIFLLAKIVILLVIALPLLLCTYFSSKYLFHFKGKTSIPLCTGGIWLLSCLAATIIGISQAFNFTTSYQMPSSTPVLLSKPDSRRIVVKMNHRLPSAPIYYSFSSHTCWDVTGVDSCGQMLLAQKPEFRIRQTDNTTPEITFIKSSRGSSKKEAIKNMEAIQYHWQLRNDTLELDNIFTLNRNAKWRAQSIYLNLWIPNDYRIEFVNMKLEDLAYWWQLTDVVDHVNYNQPLKSCIMKEGKLTTEAGRLNEK